MSNTGLGRRDLTLDVIRGGCVLLMTFGHLATYTVVARLLHLPLWVDGASGFVLLSGLVLGLVQPSRLRRGGLSGAEKALARRTGVLYAAHVTVVGLAVLLAAVSPVRAAWTDAAGALGPGAGSAQALLLRVNPPYIDILSLYVVLLALAMVAVPLLVRGHGGILAALVIGTYVLSQLEPTWTTLPTVPGRYVGFNWGAWQLLFLSGLAVGFSWSRWDLGRRLTSGRAAVTGGAVVGAVYLCCIPVVYLDVAPAVRPLVDRLLDKEDAGPFWIAMAWGAFLVTYPLIALLRRSAPAAVFRPLALVGGRSLDSYVILTVLVVVTPVVLGRVVEGPAAVALAMAALAGMVGWARLREAIPGPPFTRRRRPVLPPEPRVVQERPSVIPSRETAAAGSPATTPTSDD